VGFLRRLLGGADGGDDGGAPGASGAPPRAAGTGTWTDEDERAHELELARFEQDRTTDLMRRQQRYGDRAWTPPAQGGPKRAGEESEDSSG
jgi:hypothetical protein